MMNNNLFFPVFVIPWGPKIDHSCFFTISKLNSCTSLLSLYLESRYIYIYMSKESNSQTGLVQKVKTQIKDAKL